MGIFTKNNNYYISIKINCPDLHISTWINSPNISMKSRLGKEWHSNIYTNAKDAKTINNQWIHTSASKLKF